MVFERLLRLVRVPLIRSFLASLERFEDITLKFLVKLSLVTSRYRAISQDDRYTIVTSSCDILWQMFRKQTVTSSLIFSQGVSVTYLLKQNLNDETSFIYMILRELKLVLRWWWNSYVRSNFKINRHNSCDIRSIGKYREDLFARVNSALYYSDYNLQSVSWKRFSFRSIYLLYFESDSSLFQADTLNIDEISKES